ncbi:amino acid permease [Coniochaeta ligniaria NRRL 30616]|uniref:Amino acid permease n=1 Tax=Coniochaeta ligniaria NRRL 30616 TaxID=1408157 RepID=A0A1J7JZN2_9PEZI|nr:amino acid permease [Coniochaeta ligniaria NRRL 30616]
MPDDVELTSLSTKEASFSLGSTRSMPTGPGSHPYDSILWPPGAGGAQRGGRTRGTLARWVDSFRRDPHTRVTMPRTLSPEAMARSGTTIGTSIGGSAVDVEGGLGLGVGVREHQGGHYFDLHAAAVSTANPLLARELKGRHLQMIAIGGSIGTGLFVASGKVLYLGGPASVLLAYTFIGAMLYFTMQALGELSVSFPVAGSFSAYSTRFLDPAWGFAMGWNYALQWLVILPLEIIAAAVTIGYWNAPVGKSIFVTIFLVTITTINLFGVKGYGEAEFVFAVIKVTAVVGFILLGIVINIGGTATEGYIGGKYWSDPGAFNNGFKGLCSVLVTAAFAFGGTELVGLAAAETANPRKSLPTAIKQVFWRISLFYVVALILVGLLVPYTEPRLLGAKSVADASASPFVIAIESAGIDVLPSVMNSVILVAVMSVGNSAVFGSSRTLAALADQGQAPRILSYVDRRGRPLVAILVAAAIGLLAYLSDLRAQSDVLSWLLAVSGLSSVFTWGSICLAHIRFRRAWAHKGRKLEALAFRAQAGVAGSWLGFLFNVAVLLAQFWVAAWPVYTPVTADEDKTPRGNAKNFFLEYLAAPIVLVFYVGYKLWFRTSVVRIADMDVDTGRRDFNLPILLKQESEEMIYWPMWKRAYRFFC